MIKTMQEMSRDHLNEAVHAAMKKYKDAIRPVYLVDRNGKPSQGVRIKTLYSSTA